MKKITITEVDDFIGNKTVEKFLIEGCVALALDMGNEPKRLRKCDNLKHLWCDMFFPFYEGSMVA